MNHWHWCVWGWVWLGWVSGSALAIEQAGRGHGVHPTPLSASLDARSAPASLRLTHWLGAGDEPGQATSTLRNLIDAALKDHPLLASETARLEEKRLAADQARAWGNPDLDVSVGVKSVGGSSGPSIDAAVSQPVSWFGKQDARAEVLASEAEGHASQRRWSELTVASEVVRLAAAYSWGVRRAGFAEARQRRWELVETYLAGREFPSPQQQVERHMVENRLHNLGWEAAQVQRETQAALERLKGYLPEGPAGGFRVPLRRLSGSRPLAFPEWWDAVKANHPALARQRAAIKTAHLGHTLALREGGPDLSVTAFYSQATAVETERNVGGGANVSIPLWSHNRDGARSAAQAVTAEERLLAFQEQQLRGELRQALAEYEVARRVVRESPPDLLSRLDDQLAQAEAEFRKGRVDLLVYVELEEQVSESVHRCLEAQAALAATLVDLLTLAGDRERLARLDAFEEDRP